MMLARYVMGRLWMRGGSPSNEALALGPVAIGYSAFVTGMPVIFDIRRSPAYQYWSVPRRPTAPYIILPTNGIKDRNANVRPLERPSLGFMAVFSGGSTGSPMRSAPTGV